MDRHIRTTAGGSTAVFRGFREGRGETDDNTHNGWQKNRCRAGVRHPGLHLLRRRGLADDLWGHGAYGKHILADGGRGRHRALAERPCHGAGVSRHPVLWHRPVCHRGLSERRETAKHISLSDGVQSDALAVPTPVLHHDFVRVCLDVRQRVCRRCRPRIGGVVCPPVLARDRQ